MVRPGCAHCGKIAPDLRQLRPEGRLCGTCDARSRRSTCARCGRAEVHIAAKRPEDIASEQRYERVGAECWLDDGMADSGEIAGQEPAEAGVSWRNEIRADVVSGPVVQAYSIGTVVVGTGGAAAVPVEYAVRDLEPVIDAVLDRPFTGRGWLISQIDTAFDRRRSGYVWLTGPAGVGKSAVAAHLVQSRGWVGHFSRLSRGGLVRVGLQNLAGQLIQRFGMWDLAPGRMLPEALFAPEGFEHLLRHAAKHATRLGERLVIVVDGADEAEPVHDGGQPWGLPSVLPNGVFVVGTHRSGFTPPPCTPPPLIVPIMPESEDNHRDVVEHLAAVAQNAELSAKLTTAGISAERFAADLAHRCGGIWVYLRYIIDEIQHGLRDPSSLTGLPGDLATYYRNTLDQWAQRPDWTDQVLPLLATLNASAEAPPTATLAVLSGINEAAARALCYGPLRPFLTATASNTNTTSTAVTRQFQIYHTSFRGLLDGTRADDTDLDWYWSETLHAATTAAHNKIIDRYLTAFGGLDTHLSALGTDPQLAAVDGGYPLRHLANHLIAAGRASDLHQLLQTEHVLGAGRSVNVWFTAHDQADTIDDYLADVDAARRECQTRTDRALTACQPAVTLADELRYWLISASVTSLTSVLPAELLVALLTAHTWTADRVLAHARRLPDPESRAIALTALIPHLPPNDQRHATTAALAAAADIAHGTTRAQALTELAPHLSEEQITDAQTAATTITHEVARAQALSGLVPHVPAEQKQAAFTGALTAIAAISWEPNRLEPLAQLAPHLSGKQLTDALTTATAITHQYGRIRALTALVPYLPSEQKQAALTDALATATAITDDKLRVQALVDLAPHLSSGQKQAVLADALTTATTITYKPARVRALVDLAPHLSSGQKQAVLADALTTATTITWRPDCDGALAELVPQLVAAGQLTDALTAFTAITTYIDYRVQALAVLAPHLPSAQKQAALADALISAAAIDNEVIRARALAELAPHLSPEQLIDALTAATAITSKTDRAHALAKLAPHLSGEQLTAALTTVTAITSEADRAHTLARLAPYLSSEQLAVTAITSEADRVQGPARLAPYPSSELAADLAAATAITDEVTRAHALAELVPHLSGERKQTAVADALTAAIGRRPSRGVSAVGRLAPHLSEEQLTDALAAVIAVAHDYDTHTPDLVHTLVQMAPHLSEEQLSAALIAATTIDYNPYRDDALAKLAPHLSEEQLTVAQTAVPFDSSRARKAILIRATSVADLHTQYLPILRSTIRTVDRPTLLQLLTTCLPVLRTLAGSDFPRDAHAAIRDIHRWWT